MYLLNINLQAAYIRSDAFFLPSQDESIRKLPNGLDRGDLEAIVTPHFTP
jgi:hypothetical protein